MIYYNPIENELLVLEKAALNWWFVDDGEEHYTRLQQEIPDAWLLIGRL